MKQAFPVLTLLLAGSLAAQVSVGGVATTDVGSAVTAGTMKDADSQAKDTKFDRSLSTLASVDRAASASTHASIQHSMWWYESHSASVSNHGSLSSRDTSFKGTADTTGAGNTPGAHTITFTFSAKEATKGTFSVSLSGWASKNGKAAGKVTIGSNSWEWKSGDMAVRKSVEATIDSTGTAVVVTSSGAAALSGAGSESYWGSFAVSFAPTPATYKCTITDNKDGCTGGPALAGTISSSPFGHTATLKLTGAAKSTFGLLLHSADGKTVKLPNGCPIFIDPIAPSVFTTSATGEATHRVGIPGNRELKFSVGDLVLEFSSTGLDIKTSNTLTIECKKS